MHDSIVFEQFTGKTPRHCIDDDRVRRRRRLQARREIGRFADDIALLHFAGAEQLADDDQAGGDADAHLMGPHLFLPRVRGRVGRGKALCHGFRQRQRAAHGIFGVVFMRLRIAEIDEDAVAHIFRDIAAELGHGFGRAFVIGGDDLAQILRIELRRQRGRADKIAEHHRDLAPLGRVRRARDGRRRRRGGGRGGS